MNDGSTRRKDQGVYLRVENVETAIQHAPSNCWLSQKGGEGWGRVGWVGGGGQSFRERAINSHLPCQSILPVN